MPTSLTLSKLIILSLVAALFVIPHSTPLVRADSPPVLSVFSEDTNSTSIVDTNRIPGTNFTIDITALNIPAKTNQSAGGLEGFDVALSYNSSILRVSKMSFGSPLCPSFADCVFDYPPNSTLTYANTVDSASGSARLAMIVLAQNLRDQPPTTPATQPILFRANFLVVGQGISPITIRQDSSQLIGYARNFCQPIPSFTVQNGSFDNRPPFKVSAKPSSLSIVAGASGTTSVTVNATRAIASINVTLVVSGITPEDKASYSLNPSSKILDSTNPSYTSTLTISTTPNSQIGTHKLEIIGAIPFAGQYQSYRLPLNLTITGRGPGISSSLQLPSLSITAPPAQVFQASAPTLSHTTPPLLATFSFAPVPVAGSAVNFSATIWCGTPSYSYSWNFGDGTTATGGSTTHTFTNSRVYAVTLRVTDAQGQTYSSQQIIDVGGKSPAASLDLVPVSAVVAILLVFVLIGFVLLVRRRGRAR